MKRRTVWGCLLGTSVALALWACDSDTSDEHAKAKQLGEGCSINSDCVEPYVCVFERCHVQCKKTIDCPAPQRCVKWKDDLGVCQFDDDATCSPIKPCQGKQVCAYDGKCRDFCNTGDECLDGQLCVDSLCAEPHEVVNGHLVGYDGGSGGSGGSGGTGGGGTGGGGTGGISGASGVGGSAGGGGSAGSDASTEGGIGGAGLDAGPDVDGGGTTLPIPLGYWPLDSLGGSMDDEIGDLDGEYLNLPTSDPNGKVGTAISFNTTATNQHAFFEHDPQMDSPIAAGVSVWIKPGITLNASAGTRGIVTRSGVMNLRYAAGKLEFQVFAGGTGSATASAVATLPIGTWHHVAAGYDATNGDTLRLFLDGVEIASAPGLGSVKTTANSMQVGIISASSPFVGSIDELSLYKQALSQTEVNALFAAGNAGTSVPSCASCPNPHAHYLMNDSPDPTVPDLTGSYPGVAVDGVTSTGGKVGTAAMFVDAGDHIRIFNAVGIDPVNAFSIAMWVRPINTLDQSSTVQTFFHKMQGNTGYGLFSPQPLQPARFLVGGTEAEAPGFSFAAGAWHHLAGTWNGSIVAIYIDGALKGQATKSGAYTPYTADAFIAIDGTPLGGNFLGAADEVVLYDVALSSAQVGELYALGNAGLPVPH